MSTAERLIDPPLPVTAGADTFLELTRLRKRVADLEARCAEAETALERSEACLTEAQRIARVGSWEWEIGSGRFLFSDELFRILGFAPGDFAPDYDAFIASIHFEDREAVAGAMEMALKGRVFSIDHRVVMPDGTVRIVHEKGEVGFDDAGIPVRMVGTVHDITDRKELEGELERLAKTDKLTGAYNRAKLDEVLDLEMDRASRYTRPLSVALFDVDCFKEVNDTYGHISGDRVLKAAADLIREHMRKVDWLVRFGGDEFLVITPDTDLEGIEVMTRRIRRAVEEYDFGGDVPRGMVTVSIGVARYEDGDDADGLISRADNRLYEAKEGGRNKVVSHSELALVRPGLG